MPAITISATVLSTTAADVRWAKDSFISLSTLSAGVDIYHITCPHPCLPQTGSSPLHRVRLAFGVHQPIALSAFSLNQTALVVVADFFAQCFHVRANSVD